MRSLPLVLIGSAVLAACETAPPPPDARAYERYQQLIAGKVAGEPTSCLPTYRSNEMVVVDANTIVFRSGGRLWVNKPLNGCDRLGGNYALVTRTTSTSLCRGDIAEIMDLSTGVTVGSCALGEFIPYSRP